MLARSKPAEFYDSCDVIPRLMVFLALRFSLFFSLLTRQSKWKRPLFKFCMHVNVLQCCHPSRRVGHCKHVRQSRKNDYTVEVLAQSQLFQSAVR